MIPASYNYISPLETRHSFPITRLFLVKLIEYSSWVIGYPLLVSRYIICQLNILILLFSEMVKIGNRHEKLAAAPEESDSDNDSGGFEVFEGNKMSSRQPTFWMGTQNG